MDASKALGAKEQLQGVLASKRWSGLPAIPSVVETRPAAVLILMGVLDDIPAVTDDAAVARDLDVLLQRRAHTLSSHAGEISFPGGRREAADANPVATALREAQEETGLDPRSVEVLGTLPELPLAASHHLVTPVLSWWNAPSRVAAVDHAETIEVFRVPIAHLLDPANRFMTVIDFEGGAFRSPSFDFDGNVIWGFTAFVLDLIFDAAGWTIPWDRDRERHGFPGEQ